MRRCLLAVLALAVFAPCADAYHATGRHWPGGRITVRNTTPYRFAVDEAMRLWNSSGVRVRFVASQSRYANLVIRSPARQATSRFGGCNGYADLGYTRNRQAGMVLGAGCADDVLTAKSAAHELGHVLGLAHEDRRCALMNPVLDNGAPRRCFAPDAQQGGVWRCRTLEPDDLAGARRLYGGRPRARPDATCPIFGPPPPPAAIRARDDGFGTWTVAVTAPTPPERLVRIAGVTAPAPVIFATGALNACPSVDVPDVSVARSDFASWSSSDDVDIAPVPGPGHWCFVSWIADPQGRRSIPTFEELDVVAPISPTPVADR